MKKSLLKLLTLSLFMFATISCSKKDESQPKLQIDEKNLTNCPTGANCTYWFMDFNSISANSTFGIGDSRMFYATIRTSIASTTVSIEAPRETNSFSLTDEDVKNGKVRIESSCPTCYTAPYKLIGGYVKGVNLSSRDTRSSKAVKWLVEAKLVREYIGSSARPDTVYVKQYFYPIQY